MSSNKPMFGQDSNKSGFFSSNFANVLKLKSVGNLFTGTVNVTAEPQAEVHFEL
jgi:hypothetical protein